MMISGDLHVDMLSMPHASTPGWLVEGHVALCARPITMSPNPVHRPNHSLSQITRVVVQPRPTRMQFSDLLESLGMVAGQMDFGSRWACLAEYFNRHHQRKETHLQPENSMCGVGEINIWTQSMSRILRINLPGLDWFPLGSASFPSIFPLRGDNHLQLGLRLWNPCLQKDAHLVKSKLVPHDRSLTAILFIPLHDLANLLNYFPAGTTSGMLAGVLFSLFMSWYV